MNNLPPEWARTSIGEVTSYISRGKSPMYCDFSQLPVVNQRAIRWFGIQDEYLKYIHPAQFDQWTEERYIQDGDILWNSTGTGTIGRACLVKPTHLIPPKVVDSHVTIVRSNRNAIDPRYLFAWIRGSEVQSAIEDMASGTTNQIELSRSAIAGTAISLAPINEQKRIADKLDAVLARVDACRERLDRVPGILKGFRRAVLAAATGGSLTEEWRVANGYDLESWQETVFERVCTEITVGHVGKMADQYRPSGVPFLRSLNVRPFRLDTREIKYITPEFHRSLAKSVLRPGDVVVVRTGTPGQCCVIPEDLPEANCSDLVIIRPGSQLYAKFAAVFINSEKSQAFVRSEQVGVAQAHFNVGSMKQTPLQLPALAEQIEIVRRVDALLAYADRLEALQAAAQHHVAKLTPSILETAFRGELVPQDPQDEPASELLERIRKVREFSDGSATTHTSGRRSTRAHDSKASAQATNLPDRTNAPSCILIVTATDVEAHSVLSVFTKHTGEKANSRLVGDKIYYDLGIHGAVPVVMLQQSALSISVPDHALVALRQAIQDLRPQAVIMCGLAFGLQPNKQEFGDILIATQILHYESHLIEGSQKHQRLQGVRTMCSERLVNRFLAGNLFWQGAHTHIGSVISGKLLANISGIRHWLQMNEPDAVGGDLDSYQSYAAARDANVDWILIKAICDWPDSKEVHSNQQGAAENAAEFVVHVLQFGGYSSSEQTSNPIASELSQSAKLTSILRVEGPLSSEALQSASGLDIDEFYDQLKDEELRGLLREQRTGAPMAPRRLVAVL